jgi:putative nucleotidyltransferase with HDIG domain
MLSVLVVDDEAPVRGLMARWLQAGGFQTVAAASATEALEHLGREPASVVVSDLHMPDRDGLWLASQIRAQYPDTAIVIATGAREVESAVDSLRLGVLDYLVKPISRTSLNEAVERGVQWHRATVEARRAGETLRQRVAERQHQLARALLDLEINSSAAVDAMLRILMLHHAEAYAHARRVATLSVRIAHGLDLPPSEVAQIERGALLHDIGKVAIGNGVLTKPGSLSDEERLAMTRHAELGYEALKAVPFLRDAAEIVFASHEAFDGSGYPRGLSDEAISIGARIVTLADAYDVITHDRPYHEALDHEAAFAELLRCSGTQFDPAVVRVLLELEASRPA